MNNKWTATISGVVAGGASLFLMLTVADFAAKRSIATKNKFAEWGLAAVKRDSGIVELGNTPTVQVTVIPMLAWVSFAVIIGAVVYTMIRLRKDSVERDAAKLTYNQQLQQAGYANQSQPAQQPTAASYTQPDPYAQMYGGYPPQPYGGPAPLVPQYQQPPQAGGGALPANPGAK